jgi:hypothetical protein
MELVVLHLAGNAPKQWDIATEYAKPMHQSHGQRNAFGLSKQCNEATMVFRVTPEGGVDISAGAPKCT